MSYYPEFEAARVKLLKYAEALYEALPVISTPSVAAGKRIVSLEQAAKYLDEKCACAGVSQGFVWRRLRELHDMGRIKLNPVLEVVQTGKSVRSVVLSAEFSICRAPFMVPARKDRFGWNEPEDEISAAPLTAREIKVLDNVLQLMRSGPKTSRKVAKAIDAIEVEANSNSETRTDSSNS